ncbi:MAG TPA: hypothetical protein VGV89_09935 [Thermoplasmata archaeon]|nr:hypothetical protein [Thermoplasmata archaeon]
MAIVVVLGASALVAGGTHALAQTPTLGRIVPLSTGTAGGGVWAQEWPVATVSPSAGGPGGLNATVEGVVSPSSANVQLDGQFLHPSGAGSFSSQVQPGPHLIQANAINYRPQQRMFNAQPGQTIWENFTLVLEDGWITGTVSPQDAAVTINGVPVHVSNTGAYNQSEKPGYYYINATLGGYVPFYDQEIVLGGAPTWVNISLAPPSSPGFFTLPVIAAIALVAAAAAVGAALYWRRRSPPATTEAVEEPPKRRKGQGSSSGPRSQRSSDPSRRV